MTTPSIRGRVLAGVVERIRKGIDEGAISAGRVEHELSTDDRELLEIPIVSSDWYDIKTFDRLCKFLRNTLGDGEDAYLVELGAESARVLLESGVNTQITLLHKNAKAQEIDWLAQSVLVNALAQSLYNFTEWVTFEDPAHPNRYITEIRDALAFPDTAIWRAMGATGEFAEWRGSSADIYGWRRSSPDVVQIFMVRDP